MRRHVLPCSVCGHDAVVFTPVTGAVICVGVLGKHLRTERVTELREVLEGGKPADIERFMKDPGWREVQSDDATPAYTIGEPIFGLDAYCFECDGIYCKEHMAIARFANAGYGEWIVATCPKGHQRKVYDDYREM